MIFFMNLYHGLKLGFEYIPELGHKGTLVIEILFIRFVLIFGVDTVEAHDESNDVQDGD
jgi:hypothetical protein